DRARFDAHLSVCPRCRDEVAALAGVRARLATWSPPDLAPGALTPDGLPAAPALEAAPQQSRWAVPAWAHVAAAMRCIGVAAGVATLDVRYDRAVLTIRTGWSRAGSAGRVPSAAAAPVSSPLSGAPAGHTAAGASAASAPWRADLAALEQSLRADV